MKTSIIVCTYNEEATIFNVVAACCKHNPDAEIIVVDDGSTDETERELELLAIHHQFVYLKLPENHGKSYAMAYGVEYAGNDIVLFISANLVNLRKEHFQSMLAPIKNGQADLVLGNPAGFTANFGINPYKTVMGQKAMFKADLIPVLNDIKEILFGVEAYIALYYQAHGKRVCFQALNGLEIKNTAVNDSSCIYFSGDKEVAHALISNFELMAKRILNNLHESQNYNQSSISSVQLQLNNYMKQIKEQKTKKEHF